MFGLAIHDEESRCSLLSVKRTEINDSIHTISVVDERSNLLRESGGREHGQSGSYKCVIITEEFCLKLVTGKRFK